MNGYVIYSRKRYRFIDESNVIINRNTPVGESANFYERKPHGGKKWFSPILKINNGKINNAFKSHFDYGLKMWVLEVSKELKDFLDLKNIKIEMEECYKNTIIKLLP